ncbi:unnamed protein product [Blepharisma stoltei]|uniref:Uncharacterized protein n=1 Tax=Blepharisma stoltei TaxID=1481888 RepID=A0AAU9JCF6_9CILI|nr:unnamed protein product [Blepharisma stoltei]
MIFQKILQIEPTIDPAIALSISILLSTKFHEQSPISPQAVLEISPSIRFTNEILKYELYILSLINFRTLIPTLHDWVSLQVELCTKRLEKDVKNMIRYVSLLIIDLLHEDETILVDYPVGLLSAAVIQATLSVLTKLSGLFPQCELLVGYFGFDLDNLVQLSDFILCHVLGEELYFSYMW